MMMMMMMMMMMIIIIIITVWIGGIISIFPTQVKAPYG